MIDALTGPANRIDTTMKIHVSAYINAPVHDVFTASIDLDQLTERIPHIESIERVTDGPVGLGTRFRETRIVMKERHTEEMEFTTLEPHQGDTLHASSCGCADVTTCRFEPEGHGTRMSMDMTATPLNTVARATAGVMGLFMKGAMRKALQRDLESLKSSIESSGAAVSSMQTA